MKCKILLIALLMSVFIVPLHGGNVPNSISGQLAECVADSAKVAEDSSRPTAKDKFSLAHSLRKSNKYDEAIKEAKAGQELCTDTHSKLYGQLMQIEGMCLIERKSDNKEDYATAENLLHKSYEIYKELDVTDSWMQAACFYLCWINTDTGLCSCNERCYEYAVWMLRHQYKPVWSLYRYVGSLLDKYRALGSLQQIDDAIYTEKLAMQDIGIEGMTYILDYVHGLLYITRNLWGGYLHSNGLKSALAYFNSAIKGLNANSSMNCKAFSYLANKQLGEYYHDCGYYNLAAQYYWNCIEFSKSYWKEMCFYSPQVERYRPNHFGCDFASNSVIPNYIDCLENSGRKDDAIEFCHNTKDELNSPQCEIYTDEFKSSLGKYLNNTMLRLQNGQDEIFKGWSDDNEIFQHIIDEYNVGHKSINVDSIFSSLKTFEIYNIADEFVDFLFDNEEYSTLIIFANRLLDDYIGAMNPSGDEDFKDDPQWYEYSKDPIFNLRYEWHYSNGGYTAVKLYSRLADAFIQLNDYNSALKSELLAVEIAKMDSRFFPDEREKYLNSIASGYYDADVIGSIPWQYIEVEKQEYFGLGNIYCNLGRYEDAYEIFDKVRKINNELLSASLSLGATHLKANVWNELKDDYADISNILFEYINNYPRFAELIMECDAMYDTFWQNYSYAFDEAAQNTSRESLLALNAKKCAERDLEFANYTSRIKREDCLADIDKAEYLLNKSVDSKIVVSRSIVSVDDLRKHLRANDIAVDFQEVYYKNDTTSHYLRSTGSGSNMRRTFVNHLNPHVYANIMRSTWTSPKRVYLGDFSKDVAFNNRKWVDYVYYMRDGQEAPDIYKNEGLAKFFWSKIIEAADIKEGENIYFVPSNISDNIAIEYLPYNGETINSRYNISRISSLLQIGEKEHLFMATDKCVAFGGISDYGGMGSVRVNEGKNMSGDARCIVDRNYLPSLRETEALIKTVESSVPNIQPKLGYAATKQEFMKLDGNSPNILVLATHGFNFKEADLDKAQQEALFGNREEADLSSMEKGLLTSGLYLANPKGGSVLPIEGMLTARDVSMMNLNNVDVAILVGCSSAIGLNGEDGSYGLVRALKMAGVKTVIGALWDVDVEATRLLFQKFFGYYTRGLNCRDAMKKAQDDVKNTTVNDGMQRISYQNPYYWAGFVVID